jgi:hypothetical protein
LSSLRLLSLLFALMWSCWTARGSAQSGFLMDTSIHMKDSTQPSYMDPFSFSHTGFNGRCPSSDAGPLLTRSESLNLPGLLDTTNNVDLFSTRSSRTHRTRTSMDLTLLHLTALLCLLRLLAWHNSTWNVTTT